MTPSQPSRQARSHGASPVSGGDARHRQRERQRLQDRPPLVERQRPHVAAVDPQHVEDVVVGLALPAPAAGGLAVEDQRVVRQRLEHRARPPGRRRSATGGCATTAARAPPRLKASTRMPSSLRSKVHAGSVNRSAVSVAAIGSSQSGNGIGRRFDENSKPQTPNSNDPNRQEFGGWRLEFGVAQAFVCFFTKATYGPSSPGGTSACPRWRWRRRRRRSPPSR